MWVVRSTTQWEIGTSRSAANQTPYANVHSTLAAPTKTLAGRYAHITKPILNEALAPGHYHSPGYDWDYPRLQIRTIEQLLAGEEFSYPAANVTLAQAERVIQEAGQWYFFRPSSNEE